MNTTSLVSAARFKSDTARRAADAARAHAANGDVVAAADSAGTAARRVSDIAAMVAEADAAERVELAEYLQTASRFAADAARYVTEAA